MSVELHYQSLIGRSSDALNSLQNDGVNFQIFTKAHNGADGFEKMYASVADRPEANVLQLSIREYQFALYAAASGLYRHAYISLRLFLEMALASVLFSAHEIKYRKWASNSQDIIWASLIDAEVGVFSTHFITAFSPALSDRGKQYRVLAEKLYRECSEFVHGNIHTHNIDNPIGYDPDLLRKWCDRAESARLSVLFAFTARYLKYMTVDTRNTLEHLMIDNFGEIQEIRGMYSVET